MTQPAARPIEENAGAGKAVAGKAGALPLSRHPYFSTADLDEARAKVGDKFCAHSLDVEGGGFHTVHNALPLDWLELNYLSYGGAVRINPGELQDFFLIQIPLAGFAEIENGKSRFIASPRRASVLNADRATRMVWREGCAKLLVKINTQRLTRFAEHHFGRELDLPLRFAPEIDFAAPPLAKWREKLLALFRLADTAPSGEEGENGFWLRHHAAGLIGEFLDCQPGNLSALDTSPDLLPAHVKRAQALIREGCREDLDLHRLAEAAGVSVRGLQYGFRKFLGETPVAALRAERLRRVHLELVTRGEAVSVTEAATKWGFTHMGRFAGAYRARFGVSPSATRTARHAFH